ncbi:alpha/beta fold hydrolase [Agrococcus sp. KRD186]|uniref:alpha/beta fold hydrolase n=1 Tax=Agrococcus sp. KRD186 TaxID=2729730 RepID=UPI0019D2CE7B|nr:alpha/beta fold hydrolase [Agrococcus sp. KRD186]
MSATAPGADQELRFCTAADGTRLAWATHGSGPPLAIASCWLSHLTHDWQSPVWRHFLTALGRIATTTRFDERGFGLSDWEVSDFSLEARIGDLETIVEHVPHERFALLGVSSGAPVAIAYAARHPDRVSRLVLYAPISSGCFGGLGGVDAEAALLAIIRASWARPDTLFQRVFTSLLIPGATEQQMAWLDALQRMATSPGNAVASRIARAGVDISGELPRVQAPTLVLHAREDRAAPFHAGRLIASAIPDARLVALESSNHILLSDEPAWAQWLSEVTRFLEPERPVAAPDAPLELSAREREILGLAARGLDNARIAAELVLSPRTVERHLQNIYGKAGLSGRAARTAAVARFLARV